MGTLAFHPVLDSSQTAEVFRLLGDLDEFKGHWRKIREIRAERLGGVLGVAVPGVADA